MQKFLIMGVAGSGKSTVGRMLAEEMHCQFFDADDFHSVENVMKMKSGIPLTDEDRIPWLHAIAAKTEPLDCFVLACSALKESYRKILLDAVPELQIVFLHGEKETILNRLENRKCHFYPASMLDSQLTALEAPANAFLCAISHTPEEIVSQIIQHFSNKK